MPFGTALQVKSEFIGRRVRSQRRVSMGIWISLIVLSVLVVVAGLSFSMSKHAVTVLSAVAGVVIFLVGRRARDTSLRCPNCLKELSGRVGTVVIATGNCGFCGEQVFDPSE